MATARYRWMICGRLVAAAIGGYVIAALVSTILALLWPLLSPQPSATARADGVLLGSLLSFLWYALAVIWVFATRSAVRMWLGLLLLAALLGLALLLLRQATTLVPDNHPAGKISTSALLAPVHWQLDLHAFRQDAFCQPQKQS
jgi:hypothetical protein